MLCSVAIFMPSPSFIVSLQSLGVIPVKRLPLHPVKLSYLILLKKDVLSLLHTCNSDLAQDFHDNFHSRAWNTDCAPNNATLLHMGGSFKWNAFHLAQLAVVSFKNENLENLDAPRFFHFKDLGLVICCF